MVVVSAGVQRDAFGLQVAVKNRLLLWPLIAVKLQPQTTIVSAISVSEINSFFKNRCFFKSINVNLNPFKGNVMFFLSFIAL